MFLNFFKKVKKEPMSIPEMVLFPTEDSFKALKKLDCYTVYSTDPDGDSSYLVGQFRNLELAKKALIQHESEYWDKSSYPHFIVGKNEIMLVN